MIKEKVKEIYEALPVSRWGHVKRVLAFAEELSKKLKLNEEEKKIVQISVLFHDIGYKRQFEKGEKGSHKEHSMEMAEEILSEEGFNKKDIALIKEIIYSHGTFKDCKTKCQKILFDADKLEKVTMGEVIRKSIILHEKHKMNDEEIFDNLMNNMEKRKFHFKESKKIAEKSMKKIFSAFKDYKKLVERANEVEKEIGF